MGSPPIIPKMIDEQTLLEQLLEGGIFGPEDGSPPQQVTGALRADLLELLGRFENEKECPRLPMEVVKSLAELELLLGSGEQSKHSGSPSPASSRRPVPPPPP